MSAESELQKQWDAYFFFNGPMPPLFEQIAKVPYPVTDKKIIRVKYTPTNKKLKVIVK